MHKNLLNPCIKKLHEISGVPMPTSAHGLPGHLIPWHGQNGQCPLRKVVARAKAGIAKNQLKSGRRAGSGHGHARAHH